MVIRTNYQKNKKFFADLIHVVTLVNRRGRVMAERVFCGFFGILGVGAGAMLLWMGENYALAVAGLLFGFYFLMRAFFYYRYVGFLSRRMMSGRVDVVEYTLDDEGVAIDNALEHCVHPYHVFQGVYESRRIFVLLLDKRQGYFIAKEDLTEEETAQLRSLIRERFETPLRYFDI